MNKTPPKLVNGFSAENIERIYHGEPATVGGRTPEDVLSDRQFKGLSFVMEGLSHAEIAEEMQIGIQTVGKHIKEGWKRLGVVQRSQLAGYFPINPQDEVLAGQRLEDLKLIHSSAPLEILQALSVGWLNKKIAASRGSKLNTLQSQIWDLGHIWPSFKGPVRPTAAANGLRARYVQAMETGSVSVGLKDIGEATLEKLVEIEPIILQDLAELEAGAPALNSEVSLS